MTKTKEEAQSNELVVFTKEQIELLPNGLQKEVNFLSEELQASELLVFNPLVQKLFMCKQLVEGLEYKAPKEGEKHDKENIQTFVDAKKEIRGFRAELSREVKKIKEPYIAVQKSLVGVEKMIKSVADELYGNAEKVFQPYIDWQEAEKKRKEDEKNAAFLAEVAKAQEQAQQASQQAERESVTNHIKYQVNQHLVNEASRGQMNLDQEGLEKLKIKILSSNFEVLTENLNTECLAEGDLHKFEDEFNECKITALSIVSKAIEAAENKKELLKAQVKEEVQQEQVKKSFDLSDIELYNNIVADGRKNLNLVNDRFSNGRVPDVKLVGLLQVLKQFEQL